MYQNLAATNLLVNEKRVNRNRRWKGNRVSFDAEQRRKSKIHPAGRPISAAHQITGTRRWTSTASCSSDPFTGLLLSLMDLHSHAFHGALVPKTWRVSCPHPRPLPIRGGHRDPSSARRGKDLMCRLRKDENPPCL